MTQQNEQKISREELILQAAEKEFLAKGFDGTSTRSIAERAGVNHPLLHYYFKTKEELFSRIFVTKMQQLAFQMQSLIHSDDENILLSIRNVMNTYHTFINKNQQLPFFIINELGKQSTPILQIKGTIYNNSIEHIQHLQNRLDKATTDGIIRPTNARWLITQIITLSIGSHTTQPIIDIFFQKEPNYNNTTQLEENIQIIINQIKL